MSDDAELLRTYAQSRDEGAFREFVRRNVDLVYSAAVRQAGGDAHLAEDVTQGVFVAAAGKASALARHPVVKAWLLQATRFAAIDAARARRRRQAREEAVGQMTGAASETEGNSDWSAISPALDEVMASLGDRDRSAVVLRFFDGKSFAEIGGQLGLSEGAARMRVERALERLRERLGKRGILSTGAALGALLAEKGVLAAPAGLGAASAAAALSASAAGLGPVLGALKFMSTAKITAAVAAAAAIAGFTTAFHEYQRAETAELALANAVRERSAAMSEAEAATARLNRARAAMPAAAKSEAADATPAPAKGGTSALASFLKNPALQKQALLQAKLRLAGQYGALFKSLDLTPDQINQFKNLLVEKQMVGFDSMAAANEQGIDLTTDPQDFVKAVASAEQTVDSQIQTLLGDGAYSQFQSYMGSIPARNTTSLLQQSLSYTATPLTNEQAASVTQILGESGTPPLPLGNPFEALNGDIGVIKLSDQGLAQLQGVLSPTQVQALTDAIQEQSQLFEARTHIR